MPRTPQLDELVRLRKDILAAREARDKARYLEATCREAYNNVKAEKYKQETRILELEDEVLRLDRELAKSQKDQMTLVCELDKARAQKSQAIDRVHELETQPCSEGCASATEHSRVLVENVRLTAERDVLRSIILEALGRSPALPITEA